jgi:hypothetical protein
MSRRAVVLLVVVVAAVIGGAWLAWDKFYRERPQPASIAANQDDEFLYGSIDNESEIGLPYWVVVVLPRVFGERYLPGPGGYAALLPWEEGKELPVGFAKRTVGVDRVGFNCALCHTTERRFKDHETQRIADAGALHAADVKGLAEFFTRSASDARFNADTILTEIDLAYRLSPVDRWLYRYVFIPRSRERLIQLGRWLTSPHTPSDSTRQAPFSTQRYAVALHTP